MQVILALFMCAIALGAPTTTPPCTCTEIFAEVQIFAQNAMLNISPPLNQSQFTGFITSLTSQTSIVTSSIVGSSKNINEPSVDFCCGVSGSWTSGVGLSSTLNGIEEVQFATQVQIAATLVESLKNGWLHQ
ncbi:uncharacterized protein LACBIDRAFT_332474 [Laccaria bicolor S238N-H82]|uniref:Predicted protein n=1 Tax=Laccaria bicolor (strain S238N-H82 / ATCC MYA-4686) TaxID=486041 RepID=B0DSU8_LACBS|nr:uncharacterized protein LACBIDRAFT_332474 [Laccaria bicolor S238N-H82]EDR02378.1 predicted protein [Laccaria bicolor S238N-H82]|eukprot:XP_001887055.1 predicted protein [Laccaria bicolor S238N-H82]